MSVKPRTIDNLGIEASIRYAKDKELFEARFIEESRLISQKTEISVAKPYVPSDFDQLFAVGKTLCWASFQPPPESFQGVSSLFSYQLIPSLGGYEKQEADSDRIEALKDALQKHREKQEQNRDRESDDREEKERKIIENLLECIKKLDKNLLLINSRRNQYQRG